MFVLSSGPATGYHGPATRRVFLLCAQFLKQNDNYAIAPYQAMPVTGPVMPGKESKSSGLPILEPDGTLTEEVSVQGSRFLAALSKIPFNCSVLHPIL